MRDPLDIIRADSWGLRRPHNKDLTVAGHYLRGRCSGYISANAKPYDYVTRSQGSSVGGLFTGGVNRLDGSNDYIEIPGRGFNLSSGSWVVFITYRINNTTDNHGLLSMSDTGNATDGFWLTLRGSGSGNDIQFSYDDNDFFSNSSSWTTGINRMAIRLEGNTISFYNNGVAYGSSDVTGFDYSDSVEPLNIGREKNTYITGNYTDGDFINAFVIRGLALSESQIHQIAREPYGLLSPTVKLVTVPAPIVAGGDAIPILRRRIEARAA